MTGGGRPGRDHASILRSFRRHTAVALAVVGSVGLAAIGWLFVDARTAAGDGAGRAAEAAADHIDERVDATAALLRFAASLPPSSRSATEWCDLSTAIRRELPGASVVGTGIGGDRPCGRGAAAAARTLATGALRSAAPFGGVVSASGASYVLVAVRPGGADVGLAAASPLRSVVQELARADPSLARITVRDGAGTATTSSGAPSGWWERSASATSADLGIRVEVVSDAGYVADWARASALVLLLAAAAGFGLVVLSTSHYRSGSRALRRLQGAVADAVAGRRDPAGDGVPEELEVIAAQVHGLSAARDQERRLVTDELHDDAQQALAAAVMLLELEATGKIPEERRRPLLEEARSAVLDAQRAVSSLLFELNPATLVEEGLEVALRELAAQALGSDADVAVEAALAERPPASVEAVCYRAVRETLRALTHGTQPPTTIKVGVVGDREAVTIVVTHDGRGARNLEVSEGGHRASVCELVRSWGGEFGIIDDPLASEVRMRLPVPAGAG